MKYEEHNVTHQILLTRLLTQFLEDMGFERAVHPKNRRFQLKRNAGMLRVSFCSTPQANPGPGEDMIWITGSDHNKGDEYYKVGARKTGTFEGVLQRVADRISEMDQAMGVFSRWG